MNQTSLTTVSLASEPELVKNTRVSASGVISTSFSASRICGSCALPAKV